MEAASKKMILRIELWHTLMLLVLLVTLGRTGVVEPQALLIGGLFMGVNFFLLSYGVAWTLTPLASNGRIKTGFFLLILKVLIFLGVLTTIFFRFEIDALSFAAGFSPLLVAMLVEALRTRARSGI